MDSTFNYLARRLLWVPAILFFVTFVAFALARFGPGDPVRVAAGNFRDPEAFERIRAERGLDDPIHVQYWTYMTGVVTRLDFGDTFRYRDFSVDRKSTRLNSSHSQISYAVICLKKKIRSSDKIP